MADQETWRKNIPADFEGKMAAQWDGEINSGIVYKSGVAVVIAFLVACGVCWLLIIALLDFHEDPYISPIAEANERRLPPSPLLQAKPELEMEAMQAELERHMTGYGYLDELDQRVFIPIDRAMALVLDDGIPVAVEPALDEPRDLSLGGTVVDDTAAPDLTTTDATAYDEAASDDGGAAGGPAPAPIDAGSGAQPSDAGGATPR